MVNLEDAQLADRETFFAEFVKTLPAVKTYEEAYDIIESRHFIVYKRTRYANFESFQRSYYHYLSKRGK